MKTVKKINSITIIFFCLVFVSCKQNTNTKEKVTNSSKDTISQIYDYDNIVTNRRSDKFDWDLIDIMPVKKRDTVLFNKEIGENTSKTLITNKASNFKIESFGKINYYKTGENKFSSYCMNLKNIKNNSSFDFYTYVNHGVDKYPYNPNNMTSLVDIVKVNDSVAKFDVFYPNLLEYDIYFKINKNNILDIFKIFIKGNWEDKVFIHQLDTLISINKNNKYIPLKNLQYLTTREKNLRK